MKREDFWCFESGYIGWAQILSCDNSDTIRGSTIRRLVKNTVFPCYCARFCSLYSVATKGFFNWCRKSFDIECPFRLKMVWFSPPASSHSFLPLIVIQKATQGCRHIYTHTHWRSSFMASPSLQILLNLSHLPPFISLLSLRSVLSVKQELLINTHVTADKRGSIHKGHWIILLKAND